jgi:hypothetical protein
MAEALGGDAQQAHRGGERAQAVQARVGASQQARAQALGDAGWARAARGSRQSRRADERALHEVEVWRRTGGTGTGGSARAAPSEWWRSRCWVRHESERQ